MKKVLSFVFVLTFLLSLMGCSNKEKLPSINEVLQMKYREVNEALSGKSIQAITDAWGEPAESDGKEAAWKLDESMLLVITYSDTGTVESCELICGTPLVSTEASEDQWAIAAHVYLGGKGYFYHGKLTYALPDGYEYAVDVISVGNTFTGKDFEGNVDGKIYLNESVSDTAYFSWAEWNEEIDGAFPFLKLELEEDV